MHPATAREYGLSNGARVMLSTRRADATFTLKITPAIREDTVFVPFHWGDARSANRLTNAAAAPGTAMPGLRVCAAGVAAVVGARGAGARKPASGSSETGWRGPASSRTSS